MLQTDTPSAVIDAVKEITRCDCPDATIVAGNVVTRGYDPRAWILAGADIVKVGVVNRRVSLHDTN